MDKSQHFPVAPASDVIASYEFSSERGTLLCDLNRDNLAENFCDSELTIFSGLMRQSFSITVTVSVPRCSSNQGGDVLSLILSDSSILPKSPIESDIRRSVK